MNDTHSEMILKPVGFVRSPVRETPDEQDWWQELVSEILIDENLVEALDGIENYSHIIVLYWLHRRDRNNLPLKIHPRGKMDSPKRGIFATRTPDRPNPIGKTTVRLLRREGNILTVQGLDALDGSPVLDIKPRDAGYDSAGGVKNSCE